MALVHQSLLGMEDAEDSRDHGPLFSGFALMMVRDVLTIPIVS